MKDMKERKGNNMRIRGLILVFVLVSACCSVFAAGGGAGWGKGKIKASERYYYKHRLGDIMVRWQEGVSRDMADKDGLIVKPYHKYLHVDLDKEAIWLEVDGKVRAEDYLELPSNMKWKLYLATGETVELFGKNATMKKRGRINHYFPREAIYLVGAGRGDDHMNFRFSYSGGHSGYGAGPPSALKPLGKREPISKEFYPSFIVSDQEYSEYSGQFGGKSEAIKLDYSSDAAKWLSMEKFFFQQIDVEVKKHDFELDHIEFAKADDYSSMIFKVDCDRKDSIFDRLRRKKRQSPRDTEFLVAVEYLGEGVWYAKSYPAMQYHGWEDYLEMEFVTRNESKVAKKEYQKWIAKGQERQKAKVDAESQWKTQLTDGTFFELLGVLHGSCVGGDWWGADGTTVDNEVLYYDDDNSDNKSDYKLVYKISWAPGTRKSKVKFAFDGGSGSQGRSGKHSSSVIQGYKYSPRKSGGKVSLTFKVGTNSGKMETVIFKNISLEAGVDHGFEILKGVEADKVK